jgi:multiple sugar transport system ATP-binding protein
VPVASRPTEYCRMARIHLERVSKVYPGGVTAVDGVSLSVADHEFVVLVGPSGCGKSTTLRMIAGLEDVSGGTIHIGDRVVNDVPPKDRDIAMVFQNYALYPHMTVEQNLSFALRLRMMPGPLARLTRPRQARQVRDDVRRRVHQAADLLGIRPLLARKPRELSGGQRQRVALGRAIVREPSAFLFDEPLSNLDARLRVTTRAELKRLHQRLRTTTVYVTHDQEEAMTLGDRIVVMKDGKIQQADTPLRTYNHPANRFVAGFVGMPPMNFFDGVVRSDGGGMTFEETGATGGGGERFRLPLTHVPPALRDHLAARLGQPVVMGVRPEHLSFDDDNGGPRIDMTTTVVEPLGNDMDVYLSTAGHPQVVARVLARGGLDPGAPVAVAVDVGRAHFFEPGDAGRTLGADASDATPAGVPA